jgi:uncharacterized metal-binding protein
MLRINSNLITAEENETHLSVDHLSGTFSVYTTCLKVSNMLQDRFPGYYRLAEDGASATIQEVPVNLIHKVLLSSAR